MVSGHVYQIGTPFSVYVIVYVYTWAQSSGKIKPIAIYILFTKYKSRKKI